MGRVRRHQEVVTHRDRVVTLLLKILVKVLVMVVWGRERVREERRERAREERRERVREKGVQ